MFNGYDIDNTDKYGFGLNSRGYDTIEHYYKKVICCAACKTELPPGLLVWYQQSKDLVLCWPCTLDKSDGFLVMVHDSDDACF